MHGFKPILLPNSVWLLWIIHIDSTKVTKLKARKHVCPSQKRNVWLCASLVPWVMFTKSGFLKDRQSILLHRNSWKTVKDGHVGSSKYCEKLNLSSQCTSPFNALCSTIFYIHMHYGDASAPLLTWLRTLRILFISKTKIGSERTPFWIYRRHPEKCNTGLKWHPTRCIPGMLQTKARVCRHKGCTLKVTTL